MSTIELQPHADAVETPSPVLRSLTLLRVSGADAVAFLESQLTRNVPPSGTASLAGYCSPKGRLLASFVIWREVAEPGSDDRGVVSMLTPTSIVESIVTRLRMYLLRSKATIEIVGGDTTIEGRFAMPDALALPVWGVDRQYGATRIRYPDADGRSRFVSIGPPRSTADAVIGDATWRWLDVRAGLPSIGSATQDRFVPQMLNLEALGGVDFRKGCFPGQEVVARSQYLGKLKRRTALAVVAGDDVPEAGTDVWSAAGSEPVGVVVDAARGPDGRVAALVELPVALFDAADLRLAAADGSWLTLEPLPYALPDNEVFVRPKL